MADSDGSQLRSKMAELRAELQQEIKADTRKFLLWFLPVMVACFAIGIAIGRFLF